jgi:hypothetical protein
MILIELLKILLGKNNIFLTNTILSFLNLIRLQSQAARVRPPRRQQQGAKNPLRQIQATMPTEDEYTEVHTNLSEQEVRRLKRAQSMIIFSSLTILLC